MNLHGIVSGAIGAVNPNRPITIQFSTGPTTPNAAGGRTPTFAAPVSLVAQVQELTTEDIKQLESLNVQGSERSIYINGAMSAIVRVSALGGDLVTLWDGTVWLTTAVLERWPDWCKVAVTLQDGG